MFSQESQVMSNLKKDIEEILKDFVLWRTKIIDGKPVATYDKNMLSEWEREQYQPMEAVTQIINLIESVADKIIGKDEYDNFALYNKRVRATHRDELRAEQRDIKSKLIGKE